VRRRKGDGLINSEKWKRVRQNNEERFHFLQFAPAYEEALEQGLPELIIDFKRYFSLPTSEIYANFLSKVKKAKRRSRLLTPYLEQLATRFYYFQARIATPRPHFSLP
jgi:hypothetical protein